jgi:hypothetical protein
VTSPLDPLTRESQARIQQLLASNKWTLPGDHPIAGLDGLRLGDVNVLALLGPKNAVGSRYFQLFAADSGGRLADEALAIGLQNAGPFPAFNWIELSQWREKLMFGDVPRELWSEGLLTPLFARLSEFAPPGGHLMAEYDSPTHRATERILTLRYPAATSPIGYLMFEQGVRSYRDWYISEGGREGPRKLQGYVPLNNEIAAEKSHKLRSEVAAMMARPDEPQHGEWGRLARDLGKKVLERL